MQIADPNYLTLGPTLTTPAKPTVDERVKKVVCDALRIEPDRYQEELSAGDIPEWDSLAHVGLLQAIEEEFGFVLDVADAIEVESVGDVMTVVKKYLAAAR